MIVHVGKKNEESMLSMMRSLKKEGEHRQSLLFCV